MRIEAATHNNNGLSARGELVHTSPFRTATGPTSDEDETSSGRILIDALRSELNFYRDFFWRHQEALRRSVADDPELSASLNGALVASGGPAAEVDGCPAKHAGEHVDAPGASGSAAHNSVFQHNTFSVGYQLQLAEGRCRSLDEEAVTLHEHYRGRIGRMHDVLRDEQEKRRCVLTENIALREANHALCREVQRLRGGCSELNSMHINRLHQLFVVVNETLWRARLESEALRYLALRAMDAQGRTAAPAHTNRGAAAAAADADDERRHNQRPPPADAAAASVLIPSTVAALASTSSHHRMSLAVHDVFESYYPSTRCGSSSAWGSVAQCESEFTFVVREICLRLRTLAVASPETSPPGAGTDPRASSAGRARRGLSQRDEDLVDMCLDHFNRPPAPPISDENRTIASSASKMQNNEADEDLVEQRGGLEERREEPLRAEEGGIALRRFRKNGSHASLVENVEEHDTAVSAGPVASKQQHTTTQSSLLATTNLSRQAVDAVTTNAQSLVASFHDPLSAVRMPATRAAFDHPVAADARALREFLLSRARGHQDRVGGNMQLPESVQATADLLDPMVRAHQTLRAEVLQLRREKDEVARKADLLEQQLRATRTTAVNNKRRTVEEAMRGLSHAMGAATEHDGKPVAPRQPQVVVVEENTPRNNNRLEPPPTTTMSAFSPRVVDRVSEAAIDLKEFERIARKSADPALRGRMMRQMKELHDEVSNLIGASSSSRSADAGTTAAVRV